MTDTAMQKPAPRGTPTSKAFWDAAGNGVLLYQRCGTCDRAQHYPRAVCSHCGSNALGWFESARQGTVHAVTRVHIGLPSFKADCPYDLVLVDLDEGFRMLVDVCDGGGEVKIGSRGAIGFAPRGEYQLPQFIPSGG